MLEEYDDEIFTAMGRMRDILVEAEDALLKVWRYPASLALYDYECRTGEIRQRRSSNNRLKVPVAFLHFDEAGLKLERYWYRRERPSKGKATRSTYWNPDEPRTDDVLDLTFDDTFWLGEVVKQLPEMHKRLIEDAKIDPNDLREAAQRLRAFLTTLPE